MTVNNQRIWEDTYPGAAEETAMQTPHGGGHEGRATEQREPKFSAGRGRQGASEAGTDVQYTGRIPAILLGVEVGDPRQKQAANGEREEHAREQRRAGIAADPDPGTVGNGFGRGLLRYRG